MNDPTVKRRLVALYVAAFFVVGIWVPYAQIWLAGLGFSAVQIGIVLALRSWTGMVGNPLAGAVADRLDAPQRVMRMLALVAFGGYTALLFTDTFWPIAVVTVLIGLSFSPVGSLADGLAIASARRGQLDYGQTRMWGSLSFIAASMLLAPLIARWGDRAILEGMVWSAGVTVLAAWWLPRESARSVAVSSPPKTPWRQLLRVPGLSTLVAASAALQTSHCVLYGFASITWHSLDFSEEAIGWLWAEGVIAEVLLFLLASRLPARLRPSTYLIVAAVGGLLRWVGLAYATSLTATALLQLLHAFTFAAAHLGIMAFITRRVAHHATATVTGLHSAFTHGLAMGVVMPIAGVLVDAYGQRAYLWMAGLSALGLLLAVRVRQIVNARDEADVIGAEESTSDRYRSS